MMKQPSDETAKLIGVIASAISKFLGADITTIAAADPGHTALFVGTDDEDSDERVSALLKKTGEKLIEMSEGVGQGKIKGLSLDKDQGEEPGQKWGAN